MIFRMPVLHTHIVFQVLLHMLGEETVDCHLLQHLNMTQSPHKIHIIASALACIPVPVYRDISQPKCFANYFLEEREPLVLLVVITGFHENAEAFE